jgi:poly(3-hydroxybutyrate) depolymerase
MRAVVVDGVTRDYLLVVPAGYDADKPLPLFFVWHGNTGTAAGARGFGLEGAAGGKALFVYGQGLPYPNPPKLELGTGPGSTWSLAADGRDVKFFDAMVAAVGADHCVDRRRIYSAGHSRGAFMSSLLGCVRGDVVRGIGVVSGGVPPAIASMKCAPRAAWIAHGTGDRELPIATWGQPIRDLWLKANGCGATTTETSPAPAVAYQGCAAGAPLHWFAFDGGHVWPGQASAALWSFLSRL